jgi:hypothetical protein
MWSETRRASSASATSELTRQESRLLANVDECLAQGIAIMNWWKRADASGSIADRFELTRVFNRPDTGYSFFDQMTLPSGDTLPVMGDVPDMFYDQPKAGDANQWTAQMEEFALRYFMRISDFRLPQTVPSKAQEPPPFPLDLLSWCPRGYVSRVGFGFQQLFYKLRGSGEIRRFSEEDRFAIVDVRELRTRYEWVVASVEIFSFDLSLPTNTNVPRVSVPLKEIQYIILHEAFVDVRYDPVPDISGAFTFGYAMLKPVDDHSVLAYGPGQFDAGFQLFDFHVLAGGGVRVRMPFVVNRPTQILNISLNPLDWGLWAGEILTFGRAPRLYELFEGLGERLPFKVGTFDPVFTGIDLINIATLGQAAKRFCISKRQLEQIFLIFHFNQYYTMLTGSLLTWRQIRDWLDEKSLPLWVKTGRSA